MTAAAARRGFLAQLRIELLLLTRRTENLVVTAVVPLALLVFLVAVPAVVGPQTRAERAAAFLPGVLTIAFLSNGLVALGIATAFERGYGVLKRLRGSPLPLSALLAAKVAAVAATAVVQLVIVLAAAVLLGWQPEAGAVTAVAGALPWLTLGLACFAALGLVLAGAFRPEAVLGLANGLFLVLILLGGVVVPLDAMPQSVAGPASILPSSLVAELARTGFASQPPDPVRITLLLAWTAVLAIAAVVAFRNSEDA